MDDFSGFYKGCFWGAYVCAGIATVLEQREVATMWAVLCVAFAIAGWMPRKGE